MKITKRTMILISTLSVALACLAPAWGGLVNGYSMESLPASVEGQFTAHNGQLHYWTASVGYQIYDVALDSTTVIGLPPNGTNTNGYGDAFGVLDPNGNIFYAATYYDPSASDIYIYDPSGSGSWLTPGKNGINMANAYGGHVHNSQLYVSGLAEPWNGGYGQDTYIFAFDHSATVGGEARHDTLIQTAGNSANVAIAPNGDVYYATYSDNTLYRWTADQVASVTEDLYAPGAVDTFLTLADAVESWALPGAGNGVAVDDGGNVFFAVNGYDSETYEMTHVLAMLDSSQPSGYQEIYTSSGYMDWFGPISVDGNFLDGDTMYFSPSTYGGDSMLAITVPEPATLCLLATGGLALLRRQRAKNC